MNTFTFGVAQNITDLMPLSSVDIGVHSPIVNTKSSRHRNHSKEPVRHTNNIPVTQRQVWENKARFTTHIRSD